MLLVQKTPEVLQRFPRFPLVAKPLCGLQPGADHALAQFGVVQQTQNSFGEQVGALRGYQESIEAIPGILVDAAHAGQHRGRAAGHGFQVTAPEIFEIRIFQKACLAV